MTLVVVLVVGGFWWAGDEEPAAPPLAAAPAASDGAGAAGAEAAGAVAAAGAPAALDRQAKPEAPPESAPPPASAPSPKAAPPAQAVPSPKSPTSPKSPKSQANQASPAIPKNQASPTGPNGRTSPKSAPSPKAVPRPRGASQGALAPLPRSRPTAVAVPAITIEAPVTDLHLDRKGQLAAPPVDNPSIVGWYAKGPTPGERGTAVVVGHRDTLTGPAVFLNLGVLNPGNTVRVARADGKVAVFTVDRIKTYAKDDFPDEEVYGATGRPELRLLTCGGAFDRKTGYEANIVVFAHLTDIAQKI
ncbi:class F sortase [Streptomyces sp. NPDC056488]|uniref:class F sortase n=1 Tax=unclassified Streptomyces TaxID=2593676 RepID=UPI00369C994B